jgi:hypothetical protein
MDVTRSIVTGRRVDLDAPPDWPDGTEVRIESAAHPRSGSASTRPSCWTTPPGWPAVKRGARRSSPRNLRQRKPPGWPISPARCGPETSRTCGGRRRKEAADEALPARRRHRPGSTLVKPGAPDSLTLWAI